MTEDRSKIVTIPLDQWESMKRRVEMATKLVWQIEHARGNNFSLNEIEALAAHISVELARVKFET